MKRVVLFTVLHSVAGQKTLSPAGGLSSLYLSRCSSRDALKKSASSEVPLEVRSAACRYDPIRAAVIVLVAKSVWEFAIRIRLLPFRVSVPPHFS